ncbi:MAG: hypothetical protein BroJett029_05380 [Alphaproteobacteria bacterium]|nr:MAG: hypothetical protein BroJett029_05380 [Alphaproteobacteria bacterium]
MGEPGPEDLKLRGIEVDPDAILRFINDYLRPSDVRLLIELRAKGALPVTKRRLNPVPDWLVAFAAQDETELGARSAALKAEREHTEEKERASYRQVTENLAAVEEKDFTWKLLDDISGSTREVRRHAHHRRARCHQESRPLTPAIAASRGTSTSPSAGSAPTASRTGW